MNIMSLLDYYKHTVNLNDNKTGGWAIYHYGIFSKVIEENNYKKVAEVGIGYGTHAKYILKNNLNIDKLYLIDPTKEYPNDVFAKDIMRHTPEVPGNNFEELYGLICNELKPWKDKYTWFRTESLNVTNDQIATGSLDAVFIDGDHTYNSVLNDLNFWWDKIRVGGQILGDDYWIKSVKDALEEFIKQKGITYDLLSLPNNSYKIYRIHKINFKYTLREWQKIVKPKGELIVQASSMDLDDGWRSWPIGMCWQYVLNYQKGDSLQIGDHQTSVLCAIHTTTDQKRRSTGINRRFIIENLNKNGIPNNNVNHESYFNVLPSFKFIVSPEGNGIDCHRHYEALLAGCIPIMEKNPLTEEKYKGCPVLWTADYSEITLEYLEEQYTKMIDTTYDFSCLFLSSYSTEIQELIKQSGNFWLQRLPSKSIWYKD